MNENTKIFTDSGLELTPQMLEKFEIYCDFLLEYNQKVNLTAITEPQEVYLKHFLDSIIITKFVNIPQNATLIDVGTGAGFPAVPLKIFRPDIKITLLDSLNKRITFLKQLCEKLEIQAECIHGRAEEFNRKPEYKAQFDLSTARAVAKTEVLAGYCLPFLKPGGRFLALKGTNEDVAPALPAIKKHKATLAQTTPYTLPNGDGRTIFVLAKN
jgi:16S rRNA (guanine527-N7)-methyltransferase